MIFGDYHTHTIYSHGKGTIEENTAVAKEKGLKELAITDHGLNHIFMGLRPWKLKKMRKIVDEINEKDNSLRVFLGSEANLISSSGDIDISPHQMEMFDIIICGFHKGVWGSTMKENFNFIFRNNWQIFFSKTRNENLRKTNTKALIECVKKNPIDILVHLSHDLDVDPVEVAKVAADYGTFVELNGKRQHLTDEMLFEVAKTGVDFIFNSDAHQSVRVGDISLPLSQLKRVGIDESRVANLGKMPNFRHLKR